MCSDWSLGGGRRELCESIPSLNANLLKYGDIAIIG